MKASAGFVLLIMLAAGPVFAQKVTLDYAHDFDFGAVHRVQYVDTQESNIENPLMAGRVADAIKEHMRGVGLELVESDPDLFD